MPIGCGEMPYREVFSRMKGYERIVLLQLKPRYSPYFEEALQETGRLLKDCCVE